MTKVEKRGCDHVFFIGFLGAGKSTLARNLGGMFNRRFVDTDRMVERKMRMSVTKIFETFGEKEFPRAGNSSARIALARQEPFGILRRWVIETPANIKIMHRLGYCVYLDGDIDDSLRQIRRSDTRPDFRSAEHATALLEHRRPLYKQAPISPSISAAGLLPMCPIP